MKTIKLLLLSSLLLSLFSCSEKSQKKTPLDTLIRDMEDQKTFEIMLYDMEEGGWFSDYKHQYTIIRERDSIVVNDSTQRAETVKVPFKKRTAWYIVSKEFYKKNIDNMGMTLASKAENGKISKIPAPAGYNRYVGNRGYGHWNGGIWQFYGQYMFMSTMFHMMSPISYGGYNNYRSNYSGRRPYYGTTSGGKPQYGTRSSSSQKRINSGSSRYSSGRRTSSGSRYGGSSRSSGGSYGK
jgi:hypothetical protein